MDRRNVQSYVKEIFPGSEIKCMAVRHCRNSTIFVLDMSRNDDPEKIVMKISRNYQEDQVALEFKNQWRFYNSCKESRITSPEPIFSDPKKGILVSRYVEGTNLAHILHEIKHVTRQRQVEMIELSAASLARFHETCSIGVSENTYSELNELEQEICRCMTESMAKIQKCNLSKKVRTFFDFTPWNIIISENCERLFLIDFPKVDCVYTPHLDLARFKFSLELIKQFPPSKLLGFDRWNVDELFNRFMTRYCSELSIVPNKDDMWLIECFRKANIRRARNLKRKGKCGLQPILERAYLEAFSRNWLYQ